MIYIREAHPNFEFPQPKSYDQRRGFADAMCERLNISIPTLVDGMDNEVERQYGAYPERMYLVGLDGKIAYKGGRGPVGFISSELETAIRDELARLGRRP